VSQRDRLLGRRLPPTPVRIRIDYTTPGVNGLVAALASARAAADADTDEGQSRILAAEAATAPYFEVLLVAGIPPDRYDELVSEHQPTDEARKAGHQWATSFVPALLAACIGQDAVDPMSEKDWIEWMRIPGAAASGEITLLFQTCLDVNDRSPDVMVGKG